MNFKNATKYYVFVQALLFIFAVIVLGISGKYDMANIFGYSVISLILICLISFIYFMVIFIFTKYVYEFRVGWLLTGIICLMAGILPLILPLFWYYTIYKKMEFSHVV